MMRIQPAVLLAATACATLLTASTAVPDNSAEFSLSAPVRLEAAGVPIDVSIGHAAPYFFDFDGDGLRDLLVGEFGEGDFPRERLPKSLAESKLSFAEGKLRIYRNVGSQQAPLFKDFEYLRAGREYASIPTT